MPNDTIYLTDRRNEDALRRENLKLKMALASIYEQKLRKSDRYEPPIGRISILIILGTAAVFYSLAIALIVWLTF